MKEKLKLLVLIWTLGIFGYIIFSLLIFSGRLKLRGYKKMTSDKGRVFISNHPSLIEPALMPFLFFPRSFFSIKAIAISTPDNRNYYQKALFSFLRPVNIPIDRGERRKELRTIDKLKEIVKQGKIVILYPEGGRTFKGKEFRRSKTGERIAKFPLGIRRLFTDLDCEIIPIWVRGTDRVLINKVKFSNHQLLIRFWEKMEIIIGPIIDSKHLPQDKKKIVPYLENLLFNLADQK